MAVADLQSLIKRMVDADAGACLQFCTGVAEQAPRTIATVWRHPEGGSVLTCVAADRGADCPDALRELALPAESAFRPQGAGFIMWPDVSDTVGIQPADAGDDANAPGDLAAVVCRVAHAAGATWYLAVLCESALEAEGLRPLVEQLAEQEEPGHGPDLHFRDIVDAAPGITLVLQEGRIVYANPATLRTLGYGRAELCDAAFDPFTLLHTRDRDRVRRMAEATREGTPPEGPLELTLLARDGSTIEVLAEATMRVAGGTETVHISAVDISERVRLETELFAYTGQVGALQEVLIDILEMDLTRAEILDRICGSICTIVGADLVAAFLFTPDHTELVLHAVHGPGLEVEAWQPAIEQLRSRQRRLSTGGRDNRALADCLRRREPIVVEAGRIPSTGQQAALTDGMDFGSCLWVPLLQGQEPLGVLFVGYYATALDLNDSQVQSLSLFAAQAALAIQKAALVEQERRHQRQSARLVEASMALRQNLPLADLYERVCHSARSLLPAEQVALFLPSHARLVARYVDGLGADDRGDTSFSIAESLVGGVYRAAATTRLQAAGPEDAAGTTFMGVFARQAMLVPLVSQRQTVGVLTLVNTPENTPFSARDQQLMETFAQQAAATLDAAMLLAEVTQTKEYVEHLLESASDMIFTVDLAGNLTSLNAVGRRMVGLEHDRDALPPLRDLVHPDDVAWILGRTVAQEDEAHPYELRVRDRDGGYRTVETSAKLVEHGGETVGIMGIGRDVTERRRLEAQVAQSERLASLGSLLAGVAHELNNPLTGVLGFAELLTGSDHPHVREQAGRILAEAQRCRTIVDSLLALHPDMELDTDTVEIGPLVERTVTVVEYRYGLDNVSVTYTCAPDTPPVHAPADQLQRVLLQLLQNAYEAIADTGAAGTVRVAVAGTSAGVRLTVEDDGPGIPPHTGDRIFDPFYTTKAGPGRGLGLSMVHNVVSTAGGTIALERCSPHGTRVVVTLPAGGREAAGESAAAELPVPPQDTGRLRILVVDDEEVIRDLLSDMLDMMEYTVDVAPDGAVALDLLERHTYAAVISDVKMPVMDGITMFAEIQARYPEVTDHIMFTSGDTIAPTTRAFLEGAERPYLRKPFNVADLREMVQRVIHAPAHT